MFYALKEEAKRAGATLYETNGALQSVYPCTALFGITYFSHCIPPVKPTKCLLLGYGFGTVKELIELVYLRKEKEITFNSVDTNPETKAINIVDAEEFVKNDLELYDYILVDLFNGDKLVDCVDKESFVEGINKLASRYICVNYVPKSAEAYHEHIRLYSKCFQGVRADLVGSNVVEFWQVRKND
jgi:hypothetical protein